MYKPLSVEEQVFDKFHASKAKYGAKCGLDGTVTEFMTLMIDIWDGNQAKQEAMMGLFYKTGDIMKIVGCSEYFVRKKVERGEIPPPITKKGVWRWDAKTIDTWVSDRCPKPDAK